MHRNRRKGRRGREGGREGRERRRGREGGRKGGRGGNVHFTYTVKAHLSLRIRRQVDLGHLSPANALLDRGADPTLRCDFNRTPLMDQVYGGNVDIAKCLLHDPRVPLSTCKTIIPTLHSILPVTIWRKKAPPKSTFSTSRR